MNAFDLMLLAAIVAALFLNIMSIAVQKYWRLYTLLFGKKYDIWVHGSLIIIAWIQVLVTLVLATMRGSGDWPQPVAGLAIVVASVYLFGRALGEIGAGALIEANFFGRNLRQTGELYKRLRHPIYISYIGTVSGLGVFSGKTGVVLAAAVLGVGLALLTFVERPGRPAKSRT